MRMLSSFKAPSPAWTRDLGSVSLFSFGNFCVDDSHSCARPLLPPASPFGVPYKIFLPSNESVYWSAPSRKTWSLRSFKS